MARIIPLWRSPEISLHRFDHPPEHEDEAYEEVSDAFTASFVETGMFNLELGEARWRVGAGDVMLAHPGMRFRASFDGPGFSDRCITLTYLAADDDRFDARRSWARREQPVASVSNRLRYLRWALARAAARNEPMLAEYCATEIFSAADSEPTPLYSERKFSWYAERVHAARERLDSEYGADHTVSDLARDVGMSMFHFSRVFADLIGMPPHRYLAAARLNAAGALLRDGMSVTEACYAAGFNNLSHFSRAFARRFGAPPSRYAGMQIAAE